MRILEENVSVLAYDLKYKIKPKNYKTEFELEVFFGRKKRTFSDR